MLVFLLKVEYLTVVLERCSLILSQEIVLVVAWLTCLVSPSRGVVPRVSIHTLDLEHHAIFRHPIRRVIFVNKCGGGLPHLFLAQIDRELVLLNPRFFDFALWRGLIDWLWHLGQDFFELFLLLFERTLVKLNTWWGSLIHVVLDELLFLLLSLLLLHLLSNHFCSWCACEIFKFSWLEPSFGNR